MSYTFPVPKLEDEDYSFPITEKKTNLSDIEHFFQSYSPHTVNGYKTDVNDFFNYLQKDIDEIVEVDVISYIKSLVKNGFKNSSINRKISSLSKVFSIYQVLGLVDKNIIKSISNVSKLYKPVDSKAKLIITYHDVEAVINNSLKRTSIIVKFLSNTGLRVSEMINITKSDLEPFNTDFMRIKINGKGNKIRFIYISYSLYQNIKDVFDSESIYMFTSKSGNQLSRINIYKQVNRAFNKQTGKSDIGPHQLRHFFATQKIVVEGKDYKSVSQYLGHSNVAVTLSTYTHNILDPNDTIVI